MSELRDTHRNTFLRWQLPVEEQGFSLASLQDHIGVSHLATGPDWQESASRLVDILIKDSRPMIEPSDLTPGESGSNSGTESCPHSLEGCQDLFLSR
jgi:hypothetical protein